jgi:ParB/RepB/Spo0J family partition protein
MAKKNKNNEDVVTTNINENAILVSPDSILVDFTWNSRSGEWEKDDGYGQLVTGIKEDGAIHSAVEVRPTTKEEKEVSGKDYFLVVGFRRHRAATELGFKTIPAVVSEMTEAAARLRNVQENTMRQDLPVPDTAWGLKQLAGKATQKEIADKTGLSQPYVGKLLKLCEKLISEVFDAWRKASITVAVTDMLALADVPRDEQMNKFAAMMQAASKAQGGKGKGAWLETACKRSSNFGFQVGALLRRGIIGHVETSSTSYEEADVILFGAKIPSTAITDEKFKVIESFCEGVLEGQKEPGEPSDSSQV